MGKTKVIELTEERRAELEKGYRNGKSHTYRVRCQMVLWKSEKRTSLEVAEVLSCCEMAVNNWLARYLKEGINGLQTRAGRGRPPILSSQNPAHLQKVKSEIAKHPNSVKTVIVKLEEDLDLAMHPETLRRFLKKTSIGSAALGLRSSGGSWQLKEKKKKSS
ncbi:MAG TPA: helix-turn-helix domain-containing protein [Bacteriovoracaceae bacterium]|nr:helix-turn-helix domain-containing protein [Bacteriovoracaceae bacterium]